MPRALILVLALLVPWTARADVAACPGAALQARAQELGLPAPSLGPAPAGVFVKFGDARGAAVAAWVARSGSRQSPQVVTSAVARADADPAWKAAVHALLARPPAGLLSEACLGDLATPAQAADIADQLNALLPRPVHVGEPGALASGARWVPTATATALLACALLVLLALGRGLREHPRREVGLLLLIGASFALRWLLAPRLPMVAAQADLGPVDVALAWLGRPWAWQPGDFPPLVATLITAVFELVGPSLDAAFLVNAALGALLPAAVFQLAWHLDPSRRAAWPAGVAAATLPLAIWFSNGVSLETPAALFATTSLAGVLAWAETRRTLDLGLAALGATLFLQCRPEAFVQATVLGVALVALFARAGGLTTARPRAAGWLVLAGAVALAAPFLLAVVPYYVGSLSGRPRQGTPFVVLVALGLALAAAAWPRLGRLAGRLGVVRRDRLVTALALALGATLAVRALLDPMGGLDPEVPLVPVQWWLGTLRSLAYTDHVGTGLFLLDGRFFPGLLAVAAVLAWLSPAATRRGDLPALGLLAAAAFVGVVVLVAFSFSVSGEVLLQGLRYQVPALGMAVALAGVGLARVGERLARLPIRRSLVDAALVAVAALPALTHLDVATNVWHDSQREFVFVRDAVARLPERALVLVVDHDFVEDGADPDVPPPRFDAVFRTRTFVHALGSLAERRLEVHGLRAWLEADRPATAPVFFLRELNCYRTLAADGVEPLCTRVRAVATGAPLARVEFPHRLYAGMSPHSLRPNQPAIFELELVPLTPDELATLRAMRLRAPETGR